MTKEALQPFELFSSKHTKIYFRAPTVADYRQSVGMSEHLEEMVTTQYLNSLQIPEKYKNNEAPDSATWTAEDRRTALYWIYINTHTDTKIPQKYPCPHCKEEHYREFDLLELGEYMIQPSRPMVERIDIEGLRAGFISPLRGYAMEQIEQARNIRDDYSEDSAEWRVAHTDLRLHEVAWAISFKDEDQSLSDEERELARFDYLLTLDAEKEFKPLAAKVRHTLAEMRHGLMSEYSNGEIKLVTPPHQCPNVKEGDDIVETVLLLPFLYYRFFPAL